MGKLKINYNKAFTTKYSRDYYRGTSFHYCGKWDVGQHYTCDEFNVDFVVCNQALFVCTKSHVSSEKNKPDEKYIVRDEGGNIIGINSVYWDFVMSGLGAGIEIFEYLIRTGRILSRAQTEELIANVEFDVEHLGINFEQAIHNLDQDITDRYTSAINVTANEIRSEVAHDVDDLNGTISRNRSEMLQTAEAITNTVEAYKSELDGTISENYSVLDQRADSISATVAANKIDAEGKINTVQANLTLAADQISTRVSEVEDDVTTKYSEIIQTTDSITSTVAANKQETDEAIGNLDTELSSQIQQTAEAITAEVSARTTSEGQIISDYNTKITQTAAAITSEASARQAAIDGVQTDYNSKFEQTAQDISAEVSARETAIDGVQADYNAKIDINAQAITSEVSARQTADNEIQTDYNSKITQTAEAIESEVTARQSADNALSADYNSKITQTAAQIRSEVNEHVETLEGEIDSTNSALTQTAGEIRAEVANTKTNLEGQISTAKAEIKVTTDAITNTVESYKEELDGTIENNYSVLEQRADSISSTVVANKEDADGKINTVQSNLTQTAVEIRAQVAANKNDADGKFTTVNSTLTQHADQIASKVSQDTYNTDKQSINSRFSAIEQDAQGIHQSVTAIDGKIDETAEEFASTLAGAVSDLQDQIDGAVETYRGEVAPTLSNYPTSDWAVADYEKHIGDMYYDTVTGYAYRFTEISGNYSWDVIRDSGITEAIAKANDKGKIFINTPYPPYKLGDLWVQGHKDNNDGTIYRCITTRETGQYSAADWGPACDFETMKVSRANLDILSNAIVGQVATITYNPDGTISSQSSSAIQQTAGNIRLSVANGAINTAVAADGTIANKMLGTGIDITNGKIEMTADNIILKNNSGTRALTITNGSDNLPVIDTSSLNVSGIFSTSAWNTTKDGVLGTAQGYANTAQSNAETTASADATAKANAAIVAAAQDASEKALAALNSAKNYANSNDYLTNYVFNTVDTKISTAINGASEEILADAAADAANKANAAETAAKADAAAAQATANTAKNNAAAAQTAANNAQSAANTANNALSDWANDNKISPTEKTALRQQLNDINGEKNDIVDEAGKYSVSSTVYVAAYNKAKTALEWYTRTSPTVIDIITDTSSDYCYTNIANYYTARTTILEEIARAAKKVATDAQDAANAAQNTANSASTAAADANALLAQRAYLATALKNDTTIAGGLILSTLIQLGSTTNDTWQVWSGINGGYESGSSIAAWFGGAMIDKEAYPSATRPAQAAIRMDGSGYLAGGNISWNTAGNATFKGAITATSLTLQSGTTIPSGNISGLGSLATQNSVSTSQVTGLGALATKDKVSASSDVTGLGTLATKSSISTSDVVGLGTLATKNKVAAGTDITGLGALATQDSVAYNSLTGKPDLGIYLTSEAAANTYAKQSDVGDYIETNVGLGPDAQHINFIVDSDGLLQAKNAILYGSVYANAGAIGGILISDNAIASRNGNFSVNSSGDVYANSITLANGVIGGSTGNFNFGSTTSGNRSATTVSWLKAGDITGIDDTYNDGVYIGTDGINIGGCFIVDAVGNITATGLRIASNQISDKASMLSSYTKKSDISYLTSGWTQISGGMILSSLIKLGYTSEYLIIHGREDDYYVATDGVVDYDVLSNFVYYECPECEGDPDRFIDEWDLTDIDNLEMFLYDNHFDYEYEESDFKCTGGINGRIDASKYGKGIAGWFGGEMLDRYYSSNTDANNAARIVFRHDGSGYLGSNKIRWDAGGNTTFEGSVYTNDGNIGSLGITSEGISVSTQESYGAFNFKIEHGLIQMGSWDQNDDAICFFEVDGNPLGQTWNQSVCRITTQTSGVTPLKIDGNQGEDAFVVGTGAVRIKDTLRAYDIMIGSSTSNSNLLKIRQTSTDLNSFECPQGMFAGLRPNVRRVSSADAYASTNIPITTLDHTIIVDSAYSCRLILPQPIEGQEYLILRMYNPTITIVPEGQDELWIIGDGNSNSWNMPASVNCILIVWSSSIGYWVVKKL